MRCSATLIYNFNLRVVGKRLGWVCDVNNPRLRRRHLYWPTLRRIGATSIFAAWRRCLRYVLLDVGAGFFHQHQHVDSSVNCSPERLFSWYDFARSLHTAACAIKYRPIQTGVSAFGPTKIGPPSKGHQRGLRLSDALEENALQGNAPSAGCQQGRAGRWTGSSSVAPPPDTHPGINTALTPDLGNLRHRRSLPSAFSAIGVVH
jgi:hypothetical protein